MSLSARRRPLPWASALLLALGVVLAPGAAATAADRAPTAAGSAAPTGTADGATAAGSAAPTGTADGVPTDADAAFLGGRISQDGGAPVEFASVTVIDAATGAQAAWTSADDDGRYAVDGLAPGTYVLRIDDAAHTFTFASRWYGGAYLQDEATPVTLAAGEVRDDVDIVLERAARVCAGLFTPFDEPAWGSGILATSADGRMSFAAGVSDTGWTCVENMPPGDWVVQYGGPGYVTQWFDGATTAAEATVVTLGPGDQHSAPVVLEWTSGLAGTVTDGAGVALTATQVTATDAADPWRTRTTTTGADGTYGLRLPPGDWTVQFAPPSGDPEWYDDATTPDAATPVEVTTDVVTTGIDAVLGEAPGPIAVDVDPASPYYADIAWLLRTGIATLDADGRFQPLRHVSRSMAATFLHRLDGGGPSDTPTQVTFRDVRPRDGAYDDIVWAHQEGVLTAGQQGAFRPHASLTRAELATALYRLAGEPAVTPPGRSPFADVRPRDAAYPALWWAVEEGLLEARDTARGLLADPGRAIERQVMAQVLHRFAG